MNIKDKVVLITGSSSNIGKATALRFASEGAKIVVHCKSNIKGAQETVEQIIKQDGKAIYIQANVSVSKEVNRLFQLTLKKFGTIDILINNAGFTKAVPFGEITQQHLVDQFNDNFFGTVLCSQEASKTMLKKGSGKILNTASIRGIEHTGREGIIGYSAAKASVINFTKTLAKLLAPKIQVNAVAPGFVYTPFYDKMSKDLRDQFINSTPIKRFIDVKEIAEAFYFLATNDAITGEVLVVDGGFTLK